MVLTGKQIVDMSIVTPAVAMKIDDMDMPSRGMEPNGYTLTSSDTREHVLVKPLATVTFKTHEVVNIPIGYVGTLYAKSTYARQGLILVTNTPVDAGYRGVLTMRFFNSGDRDVLVRPSGGLMQMIVHRLDEQPNEPYKGRWNNGL